MAIDIRATITCSLGGSLISGSISDDYVQGTGLIKVRGEVELYGLLAPRLGAAVTFSYTKSGITRTIPRKLLVLSSFADPFRGTTKVQLGCKLTYMADIREAYAWKPEDDPANTAYDPEVERVVNYPIYASSVMDKCLQSIGITATLNPLTNVFNLPEFDYSAGYVQILADLLVSEGYCGFLDENEKLQIINLSDSGGTGPVLSAENIIDVSGIGVGDLPGEAVVVSYSTLVLEGPAPPALPDPNDAAAVQEYEQELQRLNWESTQSVNGPITARFAQTLPDGTETYVEYSGNEVRQESVFYEVISVVAEDGTVSQQEVRTKAISNVQAPLFSVAGNAIQQWFSATLSTFSDATRNVVARSETTNYYYDAFGNQTSVDKYVYASLEAALGDIDLLWLTNENAWIGISADIETGHELFADGNSIGKAVLVERTLQTFDTIDNATKQETTNWLWWPKTQKGQQALSRRIETIDTSYASLKAWQEYVASTQLVYSSFSTDVSYNGAVPAQGRPLSGDRLASVYSPSGDPNNGYRTNRTSEVVLALGAETAGRVTQLSMPYAPDDMFYSDGSGGYMTQKSDADQKAKAYGNIQNQLLLGNRQGMNIQTAPELLPRNPFDPFTVSADGLSALYRTNGTSWTMSADGLVVSTDALFWGATGATGNYSIYVPVAPGITTLPAPPAVTDTSPSSVIGTVATVGANAQTTLSTAFPSATTGQGVQDTSTDEFWVKGAGGTWTNVGATPGPTSTVTSVVPVANETVVANGIVRSKLIVTSFRYALELLTEVAPLTVRTKLVPTSFVGVVVPSTGMTVASASPSISTGIAIRPAVTAIAVAAELPSVVASVFVLPSATNVALAALAPDIRSGASVAVPTSDLVINVLVPASVGASSTLVTVSATDVGLAVLIPGVVAGASVAVPSTDLSIAALAPAYDNPFSFSLVKTLLHFDNSWVDSSSSPVTVNRFSNPQLNTTTYKWGTGSLYTNGGITYWTMPAVGTSDFTVECWIQPIAATSANNALIFSSTNSGGLRIERDNTATSPMRLLVKVSGTTVVTAGTSTALAEGAWSHLAVTKASGVYRLFVNGVDSGTGSTNTTSIVVGDAYLGRTGGGAQTLYAYIDDFRLIVGKAIYTSNFTPPTAAFPNS